MRKLTQWSVLVTAVLTTSLVVPSTSGIGSEPSRVPQQTRDDQLTRYTLALPSRWTAECGSDYCALPLLAQVNIPAAETAANRLLTVTLTTQYRSSDGAHAKLEAGVKSRASGEFFRLTPKAFRISSRTDTSTTLTWTQRIGPDPAGYTVQLAAAARGGRHGIAKVTGRRLVVVVDLTD